MVFQQEILIPETLASSDSLDRQPKPLNEAKVRHSQEWMRFQKSIWGQYFGNYYFNYHVMLYVNETGDVINAFVVEANSSFGHEALLKACRLYRFKPGLENGKPVKFYTVLPVSVRVTNR